MISFNCDRAFQKFLVGGVVVDVVISSDGCTRLRVHIAKGAHQCDRIRKPRRRKSKLGSPKQNANA